jgi:hypothetical protein
VKVIIRALAPAAFILVSMTCGVFRYVSAKAAGENTNMLAIISAPAVISR